MCGGWTVTLARNAGQPKVRADEAALTEAIVRLATQYGATATGASAACSSTRAGA